MIVWKSDFESLASAADSLKASTCPSMGIGPTHLSGVDLSGGALRRDEWPHGASAP